MYKKTILSDSAFVCWRKMTLQNVVITSSAVCCSDPIFPSVTSRVLPTKQKLEYFLFWKVDKTVCNLYIVEACLELGLEPVTQSRLEVADANPTELKRKHQVEAAYHVPPPKLSGVLTPI